MEQYNNRGNGWSQVSYTQPAVLPRSEAVPEDRAMPATAPTAPQPTAKPYVTPNPVLKVMPSAAPKLMPAPMPKAMPTPLPKAMPDATLNPIPNTIPKVMPKTMPDAMPKATPRAMPDVMSKAAQKSPIAPMPAEKPYKGGCDELMLAMAYVEMQQWADTYQPDVGFERGTLFPELDLPFMGEGACRHE